MQNENVDVASALINILGELVDKRIVPSFEELRENGLPESVLEEALDSIEYYEECSDWCDSYR